MRGDGAEPGADLDRYGGLLQHRRCHDPGRRSAERYHRVESGCQKRCKLAALLRNRR